MLKIDVYSPQGQAPPRLLRLLVSPDDFGTSEANAQKNPFKRRRFLKIM